MKFLKPFFLFSFLSFILWLPFVYRRCLYPFRLNKCVINWPYMPEWENSPLDSRKKQKIQSILQQKFTYLDRGSQSFVFLSEDKKYVLKLFQFNTSPISIGRNLIKQYRLFVGKKIRGDLPPIPLLIKNTFDSCKIAYDQIPDRTAVEYIHLNPNDSLPAIKVKDRLGISHTISPSHFRFAIQKYCTPFLTAYQAANDAHKKELLKSFHAMFEEFRSLHIANRDLAFNKNFGFFEAQATILDIGNFYIHQDAANGDYNHFTTKVYQEIYNKRLFK